MPATSAPTDDVYRERARLVAFLASLFPSVLSYADPDEPDWAVVYVSSPAGQLSWHIAPGDVELFAHVPKVTPDDKRAEWDGHDTPTKYERLAALATLAGTASGHNETQLREQIAAQIEAVVVLARRDQPPGEAKAEAYAQAARIARGET